ncbi:MAG: dienelactone hydrolase family protein [bacterium]|jgi:dienelactone hydrolase|nr:dipeptidyl aminopeptidase [Betaproteobacteria bacterium]
METFARYCAAALLAALLCASPDAASQGTPEQLVPEVARIPLTGGTTMAAQVFLPPGEGPFPVLVFSHGRAGSDFERRALANPVLHGHARFWMRRGYAVVAPIRPGYGITGGPDREDSGARYDERGECIARPEPQRTAGPAAETIASAVAWLRDQPWARSDRILLSGNSVGGLATIAACSASLPGVVGCINFAGGSGGSPASNGRMCEPQRIESLMAGWGRVNRLPSIWLYAPNDLFWGAEAPQRWHAAFAAGGSAARFVGTEPVPAPDGHSLLRVGGKLWSVPLQAWLVEHGF